MSYSAVQSSNTEFHLPNTRSNTTVLESDQLESTLLHSNPNFPSTNPPLHEDCVRTGNYLIDYNKELKISGCNEITSTQNVSSLKKVQLNNKKINIEGADLDLILCGVICGEDLHTLDIDKASGLLLEFNTRSIITFKDKFLWNLRYLKIRGITGFENIKCPNLKILEIDVYRERCFIKDIMTPNLDTLILNLESETLPIMDNFDILNLKNLVINFRSPSHILSSSQSSEEAESLRPFEPSNIKITEMSSLQTSRPNFKLLQYSEASQPIKYVEFNTCLPKLERLTITNRGLYRGWLSLSLENYLNLKSLKCDSSIKFAYVGNCPQLHEVYTL
ncbi:hypothetical protein WICPIJ_004257 [Wickerhamomyces pijperi]|uniref:Uncharacterized protein n=1 Tax=Wickerhamomyces pijperi TaxID=599730 RepID=A0A9P8Q612_WICPI|nr:hypothetical protein WICPIJ_004257 [Wickerhamomyces pijperi]